MELTSFQLSVRQKACRYGQMMYNIYDTCIGRSLDLYGEFSEREMILFKQILRPGQLVLDIGANIGTHTLYFARQVGPQGRVLAFEPQRLTFQMLCGNMALNCIPNVWCMNSAVGAEPGQVFVPTLDMHRQNNFGGLGLGTFNAGEAVQVVTVDGMNLPGCHLMKIDVEGMEEQVLRGAVQTLARFKPILYLENNRPQLAASLIRFIDSQGYAMFWHLPAYYNPANFFNNPENKFGHMVEKNMLCVHRSIPTKIDGLIEVQIPQLGETALQ